MRNSEFWAAAEGLGATRPEGSFTFKSIGVEDLRTAMAMTDCSFDIRVVHEPRGSYKLVGARLTDIIEPHYNLLERLIRWAGDRLNLSKLALFREKSISYHFTCERVEYPGSPLEKEDG